MDVLSDVLRLMRLRASVFFHADFVGDWSVDSSGSGTPTFHLVARGGCWLHLPGDSGVISLGSGDLVMFPRDARHVISNSDTPPDIEAHSGVRQSGDGGAATSVICGYFAFANAHANPILDALPDVMHLRGDDADNADWLDRLIRLISAELENDYAGNAAIIDKLADVLFIQLVRSHIRRHGCHHGLLAALADARIDKALQVVHEQPGGAWSVETLAAQAGMSRSAFAKQFQLLMDMPPMQYVAHWRMQRAYDLLSSGNESVARVADLSGYRSEASFSKAFKQYMGVGPGAVRKNRVP